MPEPDIQIVCNESGEPTAVIVPIELLAGDRFGAGNCVPAEVGLDEESPAGGGTTPGRAVSRNRC